MGKSEDTECPAVSQSPCESQKLVEEGKEQKLCRFRWLCRGCFGPWRCVAVYQLVPFHVLEVQQEKDDVQTLQCVFCLATKPL